MLHRTVNPSEGSGRSCPHDPKYAAPCRRPSCAQGCEMGPAPTPGQTDQDQIAAELERYMQGMDQDGFDRLTRVIEKVILAETQRRELHNVKKKKG